MVSKLWKIWSGLFIPDPGSGCWLSTHPGSRIPDPGVKKAPDPGSRSATLTNVTDCRPFVRIGSPHPLSRKRVCPPLEPKGGGATFACGWGGGGSPFWRLKRKPGTLWSLYTLWHRI
jgi:hypothetical protein